MIEARKKLVFKDEDIGSIYINYLTKTPHLLIKQIGLNKDSWLLIDLVESICQTYPIEKYDIDFDAYEKVNGDYIFRWKQVT